MGGTARDAGWKLAPEDDWFADVDAPERDPDAPPPRAAWHEEDAGADVPPPPGVGRRRLLALAAAAVALIVGGVLFARWASGSDASETATTALTTAPITLPTDTAVTPPTPPATTPPPATQPDVTTDTSTIDLPPDGSYRRGDQGDSVLAIQQALTALELNPGEIDGKFGEQTETAVIAFQRSAELPQDGVVGPATLAALTQALDTRG